MFSYRHAFHAGNHADVLKHVVWLSVLQRLMQKDKGLLVVDTHAGAGVYALNGEAANTSGESASGIGALGDAEGAPACLQAYMQVLQAFNLIPSNSSLG